MTFRLTKNEAASATAPSRIAFRLIGRRIVPPVEHHEGFYRAGERDASMAAEDIA
jgi:hypothetical protein